MRGRYEKDFGRLRKRDSSLTRPPKDDSPIFRLSTSLAQTAGFCPPSFCDKRKMFRKMAKNVNKLLKQGKNLDKSAFVG